jgi:hypothetical protein
MAIELNLNSSEFFGVMTKCAEGGCYVRVGFDSFYQNWPKSRECLVRAARKSKVRGKEYAKSLHFGLLTAHQRRRQLSRTQTSFKTLKDVGEVDHD